MVSLSSIFDMDNTTRVLLVSSILRNLLSVGIMQNYGIILTWCFFVFICKDLSEYKYDRVVTKSLDILNKLYSSQEDMFKLADRAQVFKGIEFLFSPIIFFVVTCKHKALQ